ncbi:glycosyltransferase [Ideonella dechloratans]|uniref:glycosyltransferase n=1 Tax=Ideonella dechloratans TaxID=36863 RepID=UPI0035B1DE03
MILSADNSPPTHRAPCFTAAIRGREVLFISEATAFGGHETMALRAAACLSQAGARVKFRCWPGNHRLIQAIADANNSGASIETDAAAAGDVALGSLRWWTRTHEAEEARSFLAKDKSFVRILVQGRIDSGLVTLHAARHVGKRLLSYVPMAHTLLQMGVNTFPRIRELILRHHYASASAFITIDAFVENDLRHRGVSCPIQVVENWIPTPTPKEVTDRYTARERLKLPTHASIVATIGRVDFRQKGHLYLLDALTSHSAQMNDVHWLIVGDGPDSAILRKKVEAAGWHANCHFLPWVKGGMDQIYEAVDAVALPSNYEGVPLVMLEALARRIPVIGSDLDGIASWLPKIARFDRRSTKSITLALRHALDPSQRVEYDIAFTRALLATESSHFLEAWAGALIKLTDTKNI